MRFIFLLLLIFYSAFTQADTNTLTIQRALFMQAHAALEHHQYVRFQALSLTLHDYALYPYLPYWYLVQNIDHVSRAEVDAFAKEYADTPLAGLLQEKWINEHNLHPHPAFGHLLPPAGEGNSITNNAISLARNHDPQALTALNKISPADSTPLVKEWRVRTALLQQNWSLVNAMIAQLPEQDRETACWQYWQAYSLEKMNNITAADSIYKKLAEQMNYYGLLAQQQLHMNVSPHPPFGHPLPEGERGLGEKFQRAHELYILKFYADARREWNWELPKLNSEQLTAAAYLAQQWGWYDRAIITAAKAHVPDITLRFPLAYATEIKTTAREFNLDPAWVFAIVRQESGFTADLKSNAGAFGLMQVMPHTARLLGKAFSLSINTKNDANLLKTNTNIQLGCAYLKQLSGWFKGNIVTATAAYNVGPTALQKYLASYKTLGSAVWIETLPWEDTREYVKDVLFARAIYQQQLAK